MGFNELYNEICKKQIKTFGERVKVRNGFFKESDLIPVFEAGGVDLFFKIDKEGIREILNIVINRCSKLQSKNDYEKMIDTFMAIQTELDKYFGSNGLEYREKYYMQNGEQEKEDTKVCTMSQIKGKGIAKCAEKASVANNILLLLNKLNLFQYEVNYLNSIVKMPNEEGGHAFLEFSRTNSLGDIVHLIYDVTNPEIISFNGQDYNYPAVYVLKQEEYDSFMKGDSFDNSHFIFYQSYIPKVKRIYSGFHVERNYEEGLKQKREESKKMMEEPTNYDIKKNDDGTLSNNMTLSFQNDCIRRK